MSVHATKAMLDNIEQSLIELMADFLDNENTKLDEAIALIKDPVERDKSELHIRMAQGAFNAYKETMLPKSPPTQLAEGSDMTAKEFFTDPKSPLTLDFLTQMEQEFLLDMIELYAKGKVNQALSAPKSEWISVEDGLPKNDGNDNIPCLCFDHYHRQTRVLCYNEYHKCWDQEDGDDYYTDAVGGKVTHWMPLPSKPTNKK